MLSLTGEPGSKPVPCRLKSLSSTSSDVAHSLPADIPGHDNVPRTPRTPGRGDAKRGPRFYPAKETAKQDPQVNNELPSVRVSTHSSYLCLFVTSIYLYNTNSVCLSSIGGQTAGQIKTKFGTHMWIDLGMVPTKYG